MGKTLAKIIAGTALMAMPIFANAQSSDKISKYLENIEINVPQEDSIPKLKTYSSKVLPPSHCGRYSFFAARDNFERKMVRGNSWDMRYHNKIIEKLGEDPYCKLDSLRAIGELKPGMIVGVYFKGSRQNGKRDEKGNVRKYTHTMVFAGKDKNGKLKYHHQWGKKILEVDHEWMNGRVIPMEVMGLESDPAYTDLKRKKSQISEAKFLDVKNIENKNKTLKLFR